MKRILSALAVVSGLAAGSAAAQTCGGVYTVKGGDSLSLIADSLYKDAGKWTSIHSNNIKTIGPRPNALRVGMRLNITCLDGLPTGLEGGTVVAAAPVAAQPVQIQEGDASIRHKINLLTGDGYAPFTAKDLHNGGMLTDIVDAAMKEANPDQGYAIHWVDHWGSHMDPLLSNALLDAGFPWGKPDCEAAPDEMRCRNFLFSDPMFEMLVLMFVDKSRPFSYVNDEDLFGKTICRPASYSTYFFDENGRNWMRDGKVNVVQPASAKECYEMVLEGKADAVAMNEFTGRAELKQFGFTEQFDVVPQPISIAGLHMIVHKTHPEAQQILTLLNDGLRGIHENGTYRKVIEDHLARIWAGY